MKQKNQKPSKKSALLTLSLALVLGACSSSQTKSEAADLDKQVKSEPQANTPEEIQNRAADTFAKAPGLTPEQKAKLSVIYQRTYAEAMALRSEIGQSKSLLFKTVATVNYKSSEVEKLKQKIVDLDQKRLNVMFKALADVQNVVGYGQGKDEIYKHFRDNEVNHGRMLGAD